MRCGRILSLLLWHLGLRVSSVLIRVNNEELPLTASSMSASSDVAEKFAEQYRLERGGGCELLTTPAKRQSCVASLLSAKLIEEICVAGTNAAMDNSVSSAASLAAFFGGEDLYSRKTEMVVREVLDNPSGIQFLQNFQPNALRNYTLAHILRMSEDAVMLRELLGNGAPDLETRAAPLCVVTVATDFRPQMHRLNASLAANGLELIILGLGEKWCGHSLKLQALKAFLDTCTCGNVLFLDAYDTLALPFTADSLSDRFAMFRVGIVFNGEVACSPDESLAHAWPQRLAPPSAVPK